MKMSFVATALLVASMNAFAQNPGMISIKERQQASDFYKNNYDLLFANAASRRPEELLKELQKLPARESKNARSFISAADSLIPEKILMPFVYQRYIKKSVKGSAQVLMVLKQTRLQILRDHAEDPLQTNSESKAQARSLLSAWSKEASPAEIESSLKGTDDSLLSWLRSRRELTSSLKASVPGIKDYSLSATGFIPGNQVELISHNRVDPERIQWVNDRVIFAGGKLDFSQPYMQMPLKAGDEGNPIFNDPIFQRIRDMILSSKESVFIDIFLMGGTMGGTLAKFLLDQTVEKKKQNPNFKVLLLHDFATNYNMKHEMMPVFHYIKDRIQTEAALRGSVFLLQANIQRHPPGIPFGITNLVPKTDETFKALEKRNTYYESKIDHSKVIVIDPESDAPQAYFGSKNWSDHSGSYYYDNALYVRGPAAALVQAAYYDDVDAALTTNAQEKKWMFFKEEGFSNEAYLPQREAILEWFKVKRTYYPAVGKQVVRIAEANVDGKIKDARNILVDMISRAEKNISMEQLFIYDKYINDALIKRKKQVPGLKIRILADHNGNFNMGGLPNTIFLQQLLNHGIEVRARKTLGIHAKFPDGTTQEYHQENHRKITSVDGKTMLAGSSNLNPDTLQGSFREFGAQIFDQAQIGQFEKEFNQAWNDDSQVGPLFEGEKLQLSLMGKKLSPAMSSLLNDVAATILRAKDDLEKR